MTYPGPRAESAKTTRGDVSSTPNRPVRQEVSAEAVDPSTVLQLSVGAGRRADVLDTACVERIR